LGIYNSFKQLTEKKMKFNDDITMSIASTVRDVLEGKAPVKKEEVQYPHDMYHPETGEKEVAKDEAEHKALSDKGYTHEKNEVAEPEPKGEKEFKAKHVIKKSGENNDGTVTKEAKHEDEEEKKEGNAFTKALMAARKNGDDDFVVSGKKYKVEDYAEDEEEEVKESKDDEVDEESEKQKKYQAFFNKALKKFGVDSPSELEGDKKKEFFDYVDKNYEADNESD
jgi:hypothetical protein